MLTDLEGAGHQLPRHPWLQEDQGRQERGGETVLLIKALKRRIFILVLPAVLMNVFRSNLVPCVWVAGAQRSALADDGEETCLWFLDQHVRPL